MTNEKKLKANMACAKLLKLNPVRIDKGCAVMHSTSQGVVSGERFDIFTNASQCLEVVKKLGYSGTFIMPVPCRGFVWSSVIYDNSSEIFKGFEEAIAAAAMEAIEDE